MHMGPNHEWAFDHRNAFAKGKSIIATEKVISDSGSC